MCRKTAVGWNYNLLVDSTALGFGFISLMKNSVKYLEYQFPVVAAILYIIGMIGIPMLISFCCLKRQNKDSLVERIKNED